MHAIWDDPNFFGTWHHHMGWIIKGWSSRMPGHAGFYQSAWPQGPHRERTKMNTRAWDPYRNKSWSTLINRNPLEQACLGPVCSTVSHHKQMRKSLTSWKWAHQIDISMVHGYTHYIGFIKWCMCMGLNFCRLTWNAFPTLLTNQLTHPVPNKISTYEPLWSPNATVLKRFKLLKRLKVQGSQSNHSEKSKKGITKPRRTRKDRGNVWSA